MMAKFKYVGTSPGMLSNGTPLGPGDVVELDSKILDDSWNDRMINEGHLVKVGSSSASNGGSNLVALGDNSGPKTGVGGDKD